MHDSFKTIFNSICVSLSLHIKITSLSNRFTVNLMKCCFVIKKNIYKLLVKYSENYFTVDLI